MDGDCEGVMTTKPIIPHVIRSRDTIIWLLRVITVSVNSAAFFAEKWLPALATRGDHNSGNCSPLTS